MDHSKTEELIESLKGYLNTNFTLIKLEATERSASIASVLIGSILIGIVGTFFILFISIGIGLYLSVQLGSTYSGFAIVAGFYFLLGLILFLGRNGIILKPIRNKLTKKIFAPNKLEVF